MALASGRAGLGSPDNFQTLRTQSSFKKTQRSSTANPSMRLSFADSHGMPSQMKTPVNDVKPRLLESKVSESEHFFRLSDGFKKIFANDKKDSKMIIPIVGYGGHRRGDRSQNYFGKSFRDTAIQSKRLERHLKRGSSAQR